MLLTIHNLPPRTQYSEVKDLIVSKCGLKDSILDNLQNEGSGMRVTVGVDEEEDAAILVRKINGLYYRGQQLYVENKRLIKESEQPYRTPISQQPQYMEKQVPAQQSLGFNPHLQAALSMYQPVDNYAGYQPQIPVQTGGQNTYMAYGGQQTQPQQLLSQYAAFNEFIQQPYVPTVQQNPEAAVLYARRSPSPERHRSTEGGRSGRADRLRGGSPPAFAPWASHGQDQPPQLNDYQDPRGVRNERPEHSGGFGHPKDMYERHGPRQHDDSRGFNTSNTRGGHFSNPRDMRGEHSANSYDNRGDHSSMARDMRGGQSSNSRDMYGGHSSMSRDMRGGHSSNSRDMRGGRSSNSRDMRGGHSSNSRDMRGGHSSNSRDMRGGHSSNSRDMRGGRSSNSRDMRGGHSSNSRDMRGGRSSNSRDMRGGHSSNSRDMRGGHSSNSRDMRGGYGPHAHESRGEPTPNPRKMRGGHSTDMRDNRPKNAQKRRWDESNDQFKRGFDRPSHDNWREQPTTQRQSRPLHREEPRPKKYAPQPPRNFDGNNAELVWKPAGHNTVTFFKKALRFSQMKGVGKIMIKIAAHLKILPEFEGPSLIKTELRKLIAARVNDDLTGQEILSPEEIYLRYRARHPDSDDFIIYNSITQKLTGIEPESTNQGPGPAFAPAPKIKKTALKKNVRPISPGKIPSYPQGSKKVHSQIKQQEKKDLATLESCAVNANFQKAIDEEADVISALLEKEFQNSYSQEEQMVFPTIDQNECVNQCKKLVTFHISRRITNSGPKLIRVWGHPKPPKRADLEVFLSMYRCLSLKKSAKSLFFTASFDSYDTVNELCNMKPIQIGDQKISVTFKPMHFAPKKQRVDHSHLKRLRKKYALSLIEKSKVNLLDKNWQTIEEEEKKTKAENCLVAKSDDAVLVGGQETETRIMDDNEVVLENQNATGKERKVSAAASDNNDFLHVDFKVIDEVKESDNDEVPNDAPNKKGDAEEEADEVKDDWDGDETGENWDETGENWDDIGDKGNDGNAGENDGNAGQNDGNAGENDDDAEADDDINNGGNVGDIDVAEVDWDDVNEDDLEDY